jgi:hypothetical protein
MAEREAIYSTDGWLLLRVLRGLALKSHRNRRKRVNGGCNDRCFDLKEGRQNSCGDCEERAGGESAKDICPL